MLDFRRERRFLEWKPCRLILPSQAHFPPAPGKPWEEKIFFIKPGVGKRKKTIDKESSRVYRRAQKRSKIFFFKPVEVRYFFKNCSERS
jgi:hypothetical protein